MDAAEPARDEWASLTVSSLDARLRRMTIMATPPRFTKWIGVTFLVSVALGFVVLTVNALIG